MAWGTAATNPFATAATTNPFAPAGATATNPFAAPTSAGNAFAPAQPAAQPARATAIASLAFRDTRMADLQKESPYDYFRFLKLGLDIEEQERARSLLPSSWGLRAPIDQARKALDRLSATLATAESELSAVRQRVEALEGTAHRDMDEASRLLAVVTNESSEMSLPTRPMRHFVAEMEEACAQLARRVEDLDGTLRFQADTGRTAAGASSTTLVPYGGAASDARGAAAGGGASTSNALALASSGAGMGVTTTASAVASSYARGGTALDISGALVPVSGPRGRTVAAHAPLPSHGLALASTSGAGAGLSAPGQGLTTAIQAHHRAILRVAGGSVGRLVERMDELKDTFRAVRRQRESARRSRHGTSAGGLSGRDLQELDADPFDARRRAKREEMKRQAEDERRILCGEDPSAVEAAVAHAYGPAPTAAGGATQQPAGQAPAANPASANPFAAPATSAANPFATGATAANPFATGATAANPFATGATAANPFAAPAATAANPFAAPAATAANPFAAPAATAANPFGTAAAAPVTTVNAFAAPAAPANPFGAF
ncbi:hypothetical protein FNF29_06096 [Cafeteria roenbergensis]|uniref:Nucleoporin Nup54 alpha-helical domain-containing protein n=1 Tax=Cafeteria roenbergensis TaxID=33653 RepID=A0A5A8C9C7_CAFRO|nr:hypothetical protein FNF29_06096 [Cafeteria roenbergensis]|eukprot:KAA0149209.1 hypothetical protein FNF29_06096 [Cafeteria roenbergensis]